MIHADYKISPRPRINTAFLNQEGSLLADQIANTLKNEVKLAIISYGAIATGETLKETKVVNGVDRRAAPMGVAAFGTFRRQVVSVKSLHFIISGRKAGKKMPIRMVGIGKRGGKIFEPLPALVKWFEVLNIPKEAWFPILRAISRRGIPAKPVDKDAVRAAKPAIGRMLGLSQMRLKKGILMYGAGR